MHKPLLPRLLDAILLCALLVCALFTSAAAWGAGANIRADGVSVEERRQQARRTAPDAGAKPDASAKPDAGAKPGAAGANTTAVAIVVQRGDSLDKLVKKHLGHLPFKTEFLKQALVQKNPDAFKPPKNLLPIVGATLQLPTADDYNRMLYGNQPPPSASVAEEASTPDPRRGWVRYP